MSLDSILDPHHPVYRPSEEDLAWAEHRKWLSQKIDGIPEITYEQWCEGSLGKLSDALARVQSVIHKENYVCAESGQKFLTMTEIALLLKTTRDNVAHAIACGCGIGPERLHFTRIGMPVVLKPDRRWRLKATRKTKDGASLCVGEWRTLKAAACDLGLAEETIKRAMKRHAGWFERDRIQFERLEVA